MGVQNQRPPITRPPGSGSALEPEQRVIVLAFSRATVRQISGRVA